MRRGAFVVMASAAVWLACGHDYTDSANTPSGDGGSEAAPEGDRFGPCFPNNTCNDGLQCVDGLCLVLDGATSSTPTDGGGGTTTDASNDAATSTACPSPPPVKANTVTCGNDTLCDTPDLCCNDSMSDWQCADSCNSKELLKCDSADDCVDSETLCCFTFTSLPPDQNNCPRVTITSSKCTASADCETNTLAVACEAPPLQAACAALDRVCTDVTATLADSTQTTPLKLCLPRPAGSP